MRNAFLRRFQNFFLTLPNGNEESVLAKTQRIFCSYSPLRMRSAFGKKSEHFLKSFSSHFTTEDLRAVWAKKRKTFLKFFLFTLTTGDQLPVWPKTLEIFFSLLLFGDGRSVLTKDSGIISLHFTTDMRNAFGKKSETFLKNISVPTPHWRRDAQVVRFSGDFSSSLTWEKCQPLASTIHWRKSGCLNEKVDCYPTLFPTDLSGHEKVSWPKESENREKAALSQKRLCDRAA